MGRTKKRLRLDEILVREGLISQEQINEALMRQKAHGGRLGSQLLYHRYLDEASLVRALALQFKCEGVVLSGLKIPDKVIAMIPEKVAVARSVLPFAYDKRAHTLSVACPDPNDGDLVDELAFLTKDAKLKLFVAAELSLQTAIAHYYQGHETTLEDNLLIEIPDAATDSGPIPFDSTSMEELQQEGQTAHRGEVLLVTDEEYARPLIQSLLERDDWHVVHTDSADDAIDLISGEAFHTVFIKDTVPGDYIDLIDRLRKTSPRTNVRYYESAASLLLNQDTITAEGDLLTRNLELFTSLLALKEKMPNNHAGAVGLYADRLCHTLGLPPKIRMQIVTAGYLHDLARYYYHLEPAKDQRSVIKLTVKLMGTINYSPVIVEMLRCMYKDLQGKYTKRLPIEVLGGNILTIVDLYCENVDSNERLSLDRFEKIKAKLHDVTGRLLLKEVVEPFCHMIEHEILHTGESDQKRQIMLYANRPEALYPIEKRLKKEGYRVISAYAPDAVATLSERSAPDCLILQLHGNASEVKSMVELFQELEIDFNTTPTFVLVSGCTAAESTGLFDDGIQDIMAFEVNLDLLVNSLDKLSEELPEVTPDTDSYAHGGTQGRLADMNLIDLLQAMGPARKTVKIAVNREGMRLDIYLDQGHIRYAELGNLAGAEAIYEALTWSDGTWWVLPIELDDLPEANNQLSNETILMEGCRLLDEKSRQQSTGSVPQSS